MSSTTDSQFEGLKNLSLLLVILITVGDIYRFCYTDLPPSFQSDIASTAVNFFIKLGIYRNPFYSRGFIIILSFLFVVLDKGKKTIEIDKQTIALHSLISTVLFIASGALIYILNNWIIYSIVFIAAYAYMIKNYTYLHRLFGEDIMGDRFNLVNKIFPQTKELITNDISINIPYKFVEDYKKNRDGSLTPILADGYINIVSPNRALLVTGMPGSGKSYSFNEEIIKQFMQKGFAFINYDYKFPTLSNVAYNYFNKYKSSFSRHGNGGCIRTINLDDPRYSHRCNPIRSDLITKKSEAIDAVYTLFYNIDKKSATSQDFFQMSAMAIVSASLWFLRMYEDGKYCSLPHLIEFLQHADSKILPILASYPELHTFTSSLSDALAKGAFEQLSGQTASARIPIGRLATDEMYYVMTDPDMTGVNLNVNLKEEVTVLNIANNPNTQKTNAPANGLYFSQAAKLINAQGRVPCGFHVDELPTIYINGLDNLIATARSNNVCTILSAQDYTQLVREYGKDIADSIFNTIANKVTGQVAVDTADKFTKAIGKINYKQQSVSINKDDTSKSFSTQRDFVVPPEDIAQFGQGEFAGVLADTFKERLEHKVFRGFVSPDKSDLEEESIPMVNPDIDEYSLRQNRQRIIKEVNDIVDIEVARLNGVEPSKQMQELQDIDIESDSLDKDDPEYEASIISYDYGSNSKATSITKITDDEQDSNIINQDFAKEIPMLDPSEAFKSNDDNQSEHYVEQDEFERKTIDYEEQFNTAFDDDGDDDGDEEENYDGTSAISKSIDGDDNNTWSLSDNLDELYSQGKDIPDPISDLKEEFKSKNRTNT